MTTVLADNDVDACADISADGTVLVIGLPDSGVGGRSVRVYLADQNGNFTERLNVTAPTNGPGGSRFGAQVGQAFTLLLCCGGLRCTRSPYKEGD